MSKFYRWAEICALVPLGRTMVLATTPEDGDLFVVVEKIMRGGNEYVYRSGFENTLPDIIRIDTYQYVDTEQYPTDKLMFV